MPNTITIDDKHYALIPLDEPQAKHERELGGIERGGGVLLRGYDGRSLRVERRSRQHL